MELIRKSAERFSDLFKGNKAAYGQHIPEKKTVEGEKAKGQSFLVKEELTLTTYLEHLHGERSIGVSPMLQGNVVKFGAIDVDVYPLNPAKYINIAVRGKLPLVPFRTKSGGLHMYLFFSELVPAKDAVECLKTIRQIMGLPYDTEIFPKQIRLSDDSIGNWINLPYFDYSKTVRYAYSTKGEHFSLEQAITACENARVTLKDLKDILANAPLAQGPPCLQHLYLSGGDTVGARNIFLFNCAVYLKARFGEEFPEVLARLNANMFDPLEEKELRDTIVASHSRKDYTYQCSLPELKLICDKESCKKRDYGIASDGISNMSYESLRQIKSSKPYYIWTVNGAEMVFYAESELLNQMRFRELCLRQLHVVPKILTKAAWDNVLNRALENIEIEDVSEFDDVSTDSIWLSRVTDFLTRQQAIKPVLMDDGLVWYQADKGRLHFKAAKLLDFLASAQSLRDISMAKHRELLKKLGARSDGRVSLGAGRVMRTWYLNIKQIQDEKGLLMEVRCNEAMEDDAEALEPLNFKDEEEDF